MFLTHPNIKIGKNGNAPIHRRGFHVFFQKFMTLIHTSQTGYHGFSHLGPSVSLKFVTPALTCSTSVSIWVNLGFIPQ